MSALGVQAHAANVQTDIAATPARIQAEAAGSAAAAPMLGEAEGAKAKAAAPGIRQAAIDNPMPLTTEQKTTQARLQSEADNRQADRQVQLQVLQQQAETARMNAVNQAQTREEQAAARRDSANKASAAAREDPWTDLNKGVIADPSAPRQFVSPKTGFGITITAATPDVPAVKNLIHADTPAIAGKPTQITYTDPTGKPATVDDYYAALDKRASTQTATAHAGASLPRTPPAGGPAAPSAQPASTSGGAPSPGKSPGPGYIWGHDANGIYAWHNPTTGDTQVVGR